MHRRTKDPVRLLTTIAYRLPCLQTLSIGSYTEYLDVDGKVLKGFLKASPKTLQSIQVWVGDIKYPSSGPPRIWPAKQGDNKEDKLSRDLQSLLILGTFYLPETLFLAPFLSTCKNLRCFEDVMGVDTADAEYLSAAGNLRVIKLDAEEYKSMKTWWLRVLSVQIGGILRPDVLFDWAGRPTTPDNPMFGGTVAENHTIQRQVSRQHDALSCFQEPRFSVTASYSRNWDSYETRDDGKTHKVNYGLQLDCMELS
ncbi:MAG: hypothetical protein J3R72DRAFT_477584 [Linnemannia gamsii]|nr:MAG: hypothetical protein J3R72DRAFT_477584 [Linnemannia gamsii]